MRYPGEGNKSDSINISSDGNSQLLGDFSSSSNSASSQEQDDSNGGGRNIATISEHVLFGNKNGQNSFLYLYYSESSTGNNSKRPYTTGAGIDSFKNGTSLNKMGSSGQQEPPSWNDLSGMDGWKKSSGRGSAGPSPISYGGNDGDEYDFGGRKLQMHSVPVKNNPPVINDVTPYPVYLSPVEGSPIIPSSLQKSENPLDLSKEGRNRLDSITAEIFDVDDWERIYNVPDVDPRYMLSPDATTGRKSESRESRKQSNGSQRRKKDNCSLNVTKPSSISSASSSKNLRVKGGQGQLSRSGSRRTKVSPETSSKGLKGKGTLISMKQWSSSSSLQSKNRSPLASSTPSTRSFGKGNPVNQHGVTHHHHKPLSGKESSNNENGKRVSFVQSGDGLDQISFRNGIGAFFGTPASKRISQIHETTPEEMYQQEMQGWRSRLTTAGTIFTATLFILSSASLLFVFPILVDPILVGFEAKFSDKPVLCRTTNFRNGSGPSECAIPSCREGCTLDLFSCIFVDVEYTIPDKSPSQANKKLINDSFQASNVNNSSPFLPSPDEDIDSKRSAILLININGCGYPPEVTCSDFEKKYAPLHTEFPCHYSQQNESIVVPHYSRHTEIIHLTLAVCVPVGIVVTSGIILYLLVRYNATLKASIYKKYAERKKALREKRRRKQEQDENDVEEEVTSISELEPQEDYQERETENKAFQNGKSKIGNESTRMLTSTQM